MGTARAQFPDCGITWQRIRPPVCLERWPYTYDPSCEAFTTVSSWWTHDWLRDAQGVLFDNNKRVSFMEFVELPRLTSQKLELALCLGSDAHDLEDRRMLEDHGWRVRHGHEVAGTPETYQAYIQTSRGEFSCAKPTCMRFQGAWVSDRTLCYLASGKPAVVQHTGPSAFLPNGEGMFRFSTAEEAMGAFEAINANYQWHCRKAREIVVTVTDPSNRPISAARVGMDTGLLRYGTIAEQSTDDNGRAALRLPAEAKAETVIHFAAQPGVRYAAENPRSYIESNVVGTFNLVEGLRQHPCGHLLIASTSSDGTAY